MPFPNIRSRPGTRNGLPRPNSTFEFSPKATKGDQEIGDQKLDNLNRPSLQLPRSYREAVPSTRKQEPADATVEDGSHRLPVLKLKEKEDNRDRPTSSSAQVIKPEGALANGLSRDSTQIGEPDFVVTKPQRFSLLRSKNASDPQLSTRFKSSAAPPSPFPATRPPTAGADSSQPPTIITTAPTNHNLDKSNEKKKKPNVFTRAHSPFRRLQSSGNDQRSSRPSTEQQNRKVPAASTPNLSRGPMSLDEQRNRPIIRGNGAPPAYDDETTSSLAIPVARLSESSKSDGSSGDHGLYAQTTTTHTISTTTTFFKLKRKKKKDKGPLFPLPEKFPRPESSRTSASRTPQGSGTERKSMSPGRRSHAAVRFDAGVAESSSPLTSPANSTVALTNAPFGVAGSSIVRKESTWSNNSGNSTPTLSLVPPRLGARGRSSTMGSLGRSVEKLAETMPQSGSPRTSTSTGGRRSFGDLLSLPHRLRQNSTPPSRYGTASSPGTPGSKSNSLQIPRESEPDFVYPKREESDTPATYLEKLEAAVPRSALATILCKTADEFSRTCLRKYMRGFSYFGDSIDMAVRKMLMEVELPKETQQIDRLLGGFADRYYECNPGIFVSTDEAGFIAFSILLLHSDTHNKNNKRKMQRPDYVKNTQQGPVQVSSDILDCYYDNVCYTPFIHFDDEVAINSHRSSVPRLKKSLIRTKSSESLRGPVDPYTLILDNKLDLLRPSLKEVIDTEDTYKSIGNPAMFDANALHRCFLSSATLQIVSARSRPDAFMNQATISNPAEAQAGIVSIKIAKVGLLWRKDPKKKKAKRPWQEWGVILTDSKLYFFKDLSWVKKLMAQYETHTRSSGKSATFIFKPPLPSFDPDALMSMDDTVALTDSKYKKHKNAFVFVKHGGFEEIFLANTESDMNDWIAKLNYAATFRTAGIRMRGFLSPTLDGRTIQRTDSEISSKSTDSPVKEPQNPNPNKKADPQAAWEIMFYRQQLVHEKISDFDEKIAATQKELDHLLRNARHLLILLPVQAKTREALVLAAGRMSAKLKWTRVELWRTRTHRDILVRDLEHEGVSAFPTPGRKNSATPTPQKTTPGKIGQHTPAGSVIDASKIPLSPVSTTSGASRRPSHGMLEKVKNLDEGSQLGSIANGSGDFGLLLNEKSPSSEDQSMIKYEPKSDSHSLQHQPSLVGSHLSKDQERHPASTDDPEEQVLREAGLIGADGTPQKHKRPETSDSERDRIGAISPASEYHRDKTGSVRRSLHRTLRDSHHSLSSTTHHRHKKGRESTSSIAMTEDGTRSLSGESEELRRGAGSFILHGKKASVITMSSEWQAMSNEERLRMRNAKPEENEDETKQIHDDDNQENENENENENAIDDGTVSNTSRPPSPDDGGSTAGSASEKDSLSSPTTDQFVDAKQSYESARSAYADTS